MTQRFLKFIPTQEALYLARKHPNAFILLMFIAERARRENGHPDGLTIGQCHIGDIKSFGLTEKKYRTAKKILEKRNLIKIVETCRTRKNKKNSKSTLNFEKDEKWATEKATRTTTIGTLVELCNLEIWDINSEQSNHRNDDRKGDRGATEGRPKGDEQEGKRMNKNEKDHHPYPSSKIHILKDDEADDDFSSKFEIIPGVFITQDVLDKCIKLKGSRESVEEGMKYIQESPHRKHPIQDWVHALATWKIPDKIQSNVQANMALGEKLCKEFEDFKNSGDWRCRMYRDSQKDQSGVLFECQNAHVEPIFIAWAEGEFEKKCMNVLKSKKMRSL